MRADSCPWSSCMSRLCLVLLLLCCALPARAQ
ncbi:hypothetical protein, partial [Pseudomonas aeruginosa]